MFPRCNSCGCNEYYIEKCTDGYTAICSNSDINIDFYHNSYSSMLESSIFYELYYYSKNNNNYLIINSLLFDGEQECIVIRLNQHSVLLKIKRRLAPENIEKALSLLSLFK